KFELLGILSWCTGRSFEFRKGNEIRPSRVSHISPLNMSCCNAKLNFSTVFSRDELNLLYPIIDVGNVCLLRQFRGENIMIYFFVKFGIDINNICLLSEFSVYIGNISFFNDFRIEGG